jgi:hypothetical protein
MRTCIGSRPSAIEKGGVPCGTPLRTMVYANVSTATLLRNRWLRLSKSSLVKSSDVTELSQTVRERLCQATTCGAAFDANEMQPVGW